MDSIKETPLQGVEIATNICKIRMAIGSKGKGKSGGARVITFNVLTDIQNGHVFFLLIYDKEEDSSVKVDVVKEWCVIPLTAVSKANIMKKRTLHQ